MKQQHLLLIADGRSPTAQSWIGLMLGQGFKISLISTFPCQPLPGVNFQTTIPVAFSHFAGGEGDNPAGKSTASSQRFSLKKFIRRFAPLFQFLRYYAGPLTLLPLKKPYQALLAELKPDLVHALRIPFEGMLGSLTPPEIPFVVSTWGNDLTLHAKKSPLMRHWTRQTLRRATGLTSDTRRDVRLAFDWGLPPASPTLVVPGCGGLDLEVLAESALPPFDALAFNLPQDVPWVVNPRGFRPGSVHNDVFFAAIARVKQAGVKAAFICPAFASQQKALAWVQQHGIEDYTHLLPKLPQPQLWALFRRCALFVSPSSHDGTPNTLLEALACGCFPVAGDIESLREWVTAGENGLLVNPRDADALAQAIIRALGDEAWRAQVRRENPQMIARRADARVTAPLIAAFYRRLIKP